MATHSGIVAWKILGPKEPGGLQFMATVHHKKIGHDLVTKQQQKSYSRILWRGLCLYVVGVRFADLGMKGLFRLRNSPMMLALN